MGMTTRMIALAMCLFLVLPLVLRDMLSVAGLFLKQTRELWAWLREIDDQLFGD